MTTPVDIATKQLRLHGQDCVCDGCEVARALISFSGPSLPQRTTGERDSIILSLNRQIRELELAKDLIKKEMDIREIARHELTKALSDSESSVDNLTKRLVEANNKLLKQQEGSPEEYKKKMEFYKSMAQEWKNKSTMLEKELSMHDPAARWDNPLYDPGYGPGLKGNVKGSM